MAVIGVPHEKYGEVPRAYVVKHDGAQGLTEDSVKAHVAEKLTGMLLTRIFLKRQKEVATELLLKDMNSIHLKMRTSASKPGNYRRVQKT